MHGVEQLTIRKTIYETMHASDKESPTRIFKIHFEEHIYKWYDRFLVINSHPILLITKLYMQASNASIIN